MTDSIYVEKFDEVYLRVTADPGIEMEISEHFRFLKEGYKYTTLYKAGVWDGYLRLYNIGRKSLYVGLYDELKAFAARNGYDIVEKPSKRFPNVNNYQNLDKEEVFKWAKNLGHSLDGQPIELYQHQLEGTYAAINENRITLLMPTSSGKSCVIYNLVRWHLEHDRRILLICPTTQLVEQMYSDFIDYSELNGWNVEDYCQRLYSGLSKEITKPVLISTWQSIHSNEKKKKETKTKKTSSKAILNVGPEDFDVALIDETHLASAEALTNLLDSMTETKFRVGLTGTLDDSKANKLQICGMLGREYKVITTKELMDLGLVVKLDIRCLVLDHNEEDRGLVNKCEYDDELAFIMTLDKRNRFIVNLAMACQGNTLVLITWVEKHLEKLAQIFEEKGRKVFIIHGKIDTEERERIRLLLENETDAIVLATSQTCSTGINIPSIENIILGAAGKSKIRNLQSIGRGLRLKKGKDGCKLFDIADNLTSKKGKKTYENHLFRHFKIRLSIYDREHFDYKIVQVPFK